jgi:hypothetical protein
MAPKGETLFSEKNREEEEETRYAGAQWWKCCSHLEKMEKKKAEKRQGMLVHEREMLFSS